MSLTITERYQQLSRPRLRCFDYLGVETGDQWLHPSSGLLRRHWTAGNQLSANDCRTIATATISTSRWTTNYFIDTTSRSTPWWSRPPAGEYRTQAHAYRIIWLICIMMS